MEFRIKQIIGEANTRNSNNINEAIRYLLNRLSSKDIEEKKKFYEKIKTFKKEKREIEERKFLNYLHEKYLLQEKQVEERRQEERKEKNRKERVFQEKMRLHELKEKITNINWENIESELESILSNLKKLFEDNNENNNQSVYTFYTQLHKDILKQFTKLYKTGISYFFKQNYDFKPGSELFKLEEFKMIISEFEELQMSNSGISIDIAETFLETKNNDDELIEANIILAIKIAHSIYKDYIDELEKNFKTLRSEFEGIVSDKLIYVALYLNNNYIDSARKFLKAKKNTSGSWANNSPQPTLPIPNNSDNQQQTTNFSQGIQQLTSHKSQSEFHLLGEYDEEEKSLHESQRNYILYNNEKYDLSEFIGDSLIDYDFYEALDDLLYSISNDQYISFEIGNLNIAKKYREKIKCNINQLKKKIIKYKIFEIFCGKQFSREIFSNNNIEFHQIVNYMIFLFN